MVEIGWKHGAEGDLLQVFSDLEDYRNGAGERFVTQLDGTLQVLRSHPQMAPVYEQPARRLVVGNSGYGLFYTVEPRGIIIHALIHLSQSPEAIRDRIRRSLDLS